MNAGLKACFGIIFIALGAISALGQSGGVAASIKLTKIERKTLDESIPTGVRQFLESADRVEIFAQLEVRDGKLEPAMDRELAPNFKAVVENNETRKKLLRALYSEASKGEPHAICYLPSHSIVAKKGTREITVEICFGCNRFIITGALGKSNGTFSRSSGETERLITKLIQDLGVTTK